MSIEEQAVPVQEQAADEVQQIPAVIRVREVPAAAEAREKILQAIAAEASAITGKDRARWTMRWKTALNAFDITFDGRLSAARQQPSTTRVTPLV
ncbi:hypothetical protein [Streptomyces altiplanensis]